MLLSGAAAVGLSGGVLRAFCACFNIIQFASSKNKNKK
jgi:hypothetical protein